MTDQRDADLARRYLRFADEEAHGRSPRYKEFARGVAGDAAVRQFLASLPAAKQQPNLLLAAMRHLFGVLPDWEGFRRHLLANTDAIGAIMRARSTQTNEPARCAVLLPILARLPQPLALIEVGASAGLCLLPDRYGYDYGTHALRPAADFGGPVFPCTADAATPRPACLPQIAWRAGLDLNPIDATDPQQTAWLENLVWPEQTARLARLRAALRIAAADPPRILPGDLRGDALADLCRAAPADATLVVFHTAVLTYVADPAERQAFADRMASLSPCWICNEATGVLPALDRRAGPARIPGRFLLSVNGAPTAWTDAHGAAMEWIARRDGDLPARTG